MIDPRLVLPISILKVKRNYEKKLLSYVSEDKYPERVKTHKEIIGSYEYAIRLLESENKK